MTQVPDATDGDPDVLTGPGPPSRLVLGVGLLTTLVAGALVVVHLSRHHSGADRGPVLPTAVAVRTASTSAAPTFTRPPSADAIAYTGVFAESTSLGSGDVAYDFSLVNTTTHDLRIEYPIRFVGAGGRVLPITFAGIYDESTAQAHVNDFRPRAHRLGVISAGATVSLLLGIHIVCGIDAEVNPDATDPLRIEIPLRGQRFPAIFTLTELATGFGDVVDQVCG